jgi:Transcriptional regulators
VTDVEISELAQTYRLRTELAELTGKLDPIALSPALLASLQALSARSKALLRAPDPRCFAELNMEFFQTLLQLTGNEPLRAISERLYFQTTRIWLKSVVASKIELKDEVIVFDREIDDILRALHVGDLHAAALIQRAHISMSFARMRRGTTPAPEPAPGAEQG